MKARMLCTLLSALLLLSLLSGCGKIPKETVPPSPSYTDADAAIQGLRRAQLAWMEEATGHTMAVTAEAITFSYNEGAQLASFPEEWTQAWHQWENEAGSKRDHLDFVVSPQKTGGLCKKDGELYFIYSDDGGEN